VQILGVEEEEK